MKILQTATITDASRFPFKSGTLQFLQDAYKDIMLYNLRRIIGDTFSNSTPYILYGCNKSSSLGNTTITEGAVFFNNEIFFSPLYAFPDASGGNVIIANILTTNYTSNADPVTFSDGATRSVHDVRVVQFTTGASGSGSMSNFSNFVYSYEDIVSVSPINGATIKFDRTKTVICSGTGSISYTLDAANCTIGTTIRILIYTGGVSTSPSASNSLATSYVMASILSSVSGSDGYILIEYKYLGQNGGNYFVSESMKSFTPPI